MGVGPRQVVAQGIHRDDLVDGQVHRLADAGPDRPDDGRPDDRIGGGVHEDLRGGIADALSSALDHAELEGQEFVEGQPTQRGVPAGERRRVVRLLDGPGDRHQVLITGDGGGQVLRVGVAGLVERLADRGAEADGGQPRGQRVDRHDPARVQQLRLAHLARKHLELGVVEGQPAPEVLDLPGHDDLGTDMQAPLDEPTTEPGRVDRARVVLESRDRPLGPTAKPALDPDIADGRLGRDHVPVRDEQQVPELAHLAQVVVPARQVEQQVADVVEPELDPRSTKGGRRAEPGPRERGREELDRIGRRWRRARCLGQPATRRRSGSGSRAGRHAGPPPPRRGRPSPGSGPWPPLR